MSLSKAPLFICLKQFFLFFFSISFSCCAGGRKNFRIPSWAVASDVFGNAIVSLLLMLHCSNNNIGHDFTIHFFHSHASPHNPLSKRDENLVKCQLLKQTVKIFVFSRAIYHCLRNKKIIHFRVKFLISRGTNNCD
jgi:hypothetical protein